MKPSALVVAAFSIALGCLFATAGANDPQPDATFDFGQVWQGSVLKPCVLIKNTSPKPVKIRMVQAHHASARFPNLTLKAGEEVVQPLPPVNTRDFSGPIRKSYLLLLDPPVPLEVALFESCEGE